MSKSKTVFFFFVLFFLCFLTACSSKEQKKVPKIGASETPAPNIKKEEDEKVSLIFLTNRRNLVGEVFNSYAEKFNEKYPNISISFKFVEDYENKVTSFIRSYDEWGDICMIPDTVAPKELLEYFTPFGAVDELGIKYDYIEERAKDGIVYGIPSSANVQGILYNKRIWKKAGIKKIPKTPEQFLKALHKIKDKTDAIPFYSNYNSGWALASWEENCYGTATGSREYRNSLIKKDEPFKKGTPHYKIYKVLYNIAAQGLIEKNPQKDSWEQCRQFIEEGKASCTAIASGSIMETIEDAKTPGDIGFIPFPYSIQDRQYTTIATDYSFGINKRSSTEKIEAAKKFVLWLTDESDFYKYQGGISIVKDSEYADYLSEYRKTNVIPVKNDPESVEDEGKFAELAQRSRMYLKQGREKERIIDAAINGTRTFDEIINWWNRRWTAARKDMNLE